MPKILVTGGAGYIGSHTTRLLLQRGFDVIVVDNLSRGFAHNVEPQRLRQISLHETEKLTTLLRDEAVEAVDPLRRIHLGGRIDELTQPCIFKTTPPVHSRYSRDGVTPK